MIFVPWLFAVVTAGWFGLAARRAGRNLVPWVLSGFVFGLIASTIVLGLGRATGNPFSDEQRNLFHLRWTLEAFVIIAVLGFFITTPLHQQHMSVWRRLTRKPLPPSPPAPRVEAKPKPEAPKPAAKS